MAVMDLPLGQSAQPRDMAAIKAQLTSLYIYIAVDLIALLPIGFVAIFSGSVMLLTDLINYGKGTFSSLFAVAILRSIETGNTGRFEHGVARLATLGTLLMSLIVNLSLFGGICFAVYRLFHPHSIENVYTILGAGIKFLAIGTNLWLMLHNLKLARKTRSPLMSATWRMAFADMMLAISIFVTICLTYAFSSHWWSVYIDPVAAIIALSIGMASYAPLVKRLVSELIDLSIDEDHHVAIMRALSKHFEKYTAFHGVKTRYEGGKPHINITLSFPGTLSVDEALLRIKEIKASITEEVRGAIVEITIVPPAVKP